MGKRKKKKQNVSVEANVETKIDSTPAEAELNTEKDDTSVLDELEAYLDEIEKEGVELVGEDPDEETERFPAKAREEQKGKKQDVFSLVAGIVIGLLVVALFAVGYQIYRKSSVKVSQDDTVATTAAEQESEEARSEEGTEEITDSVVEAGTEETAKESEEKTTEDTTAENALATEQEATEKTAENKITIEEAFQTLNQNYEGNVRLEKKLKAVADEAEWVRSNPKLYPENEYEKASKNPELLHFLYKYGKGNFSKDKKETMTEEDKRDGAFCIYQWDERWGYHSYGSSILAITGCGPTCMAMVVGTLLDDKTVTPSQLADYAMANDLYSFGAGTKWEFMERVADEYHLSCVGIYYDKESLLEELHDGKIIVAVVGEGHFTTDGHFIVIVGEKNGKFIVHDPNNYENTHTLWKYEDIKDELGGAWAFSE